MDKPENLNGIRREALRKMENSEKTAKVFLVLTALVEGGCLIGYLLLMDFSERLHWLLLVMAFLIYGTLAFGLLTLGAYTRHWILRVVCALESNEESSV